MVISADHYQIGGTPATTVSGFSLIAEDGNVIPGVPKVQTDVFMAAGKVLDVMINGPAAGAAALPVYDRELSLSGNAINRDNGMLAYISNNGGGLPVTGALGAAVARADTYNSLVASQTFSVSDPSKGVIANDTNVYGVQLLTAPGNGSATLYANGTFTYVPSGTATSDSFTYCANGTVTAGVCSSGLTATVNLGAATLEGAGGITMGNITYTANMATYLSIKNPGILSVDSDAAGYPLKVALSTISAQAGLTLHVDSNGGFDASVPAAGTCTFTYQAQNSQGTLSTSAATVTLNFPTPSNLTVTVKDPMGNIISDYRWVIEEDRTFYINPATVTNTGGTSIVPTLGVNFHTSYMPYIAQGCTGMYSCEGGQMMVDPTTGAHVNAVCDVGNGACRPDPTGNGFTPVNPSQVSLDPTKRYYISVLPGDASNPFVAGYTGTPDCSPAGMTAGHCGHGMGGASHPLSRCQYRRHGADAALALPAVQTFGICLRG